MSQTHEYFLACWLAGIDPDDIVCRDNNERYDMLTTYFKAETLFQHAGTVVRRLSQDNGG